MYRFGLLGADRRMKALELALKKDGYGAQMLGSNSDFDEFNVIILPPGCDFKCLQSKCRGKTVLAPFDADGCINYLKSEQFKRENAMPSAEGAIYELMGMTDGTVCGMEVGIVGFGCIGHELRRMLEGLGAYVTVFARGDKAGTRPISELKNIGVTALFNTVPAKVIDRDILCSLPRKPIIIDLASRPGGVDFETARVLGIRCVHRLGIPGLYAPETAGGILKNTVISILRGVK